MPSLTAPLRDEHRELLPHIDRLRTAADAVGTSSVAELLRAVDEAHDFLAHHLIPHAQAEDRALYPVVAKLIGGAEATSTMSRDHVEVGRLTDELAGLRERLAGAARLPDDLARDLRRVLYGLHALVKVHFAKEEEVYLPILDARLDPAGAAAMFGAMHSAAREAKGSHGH